MKQHALKGFTEYYKFILGRAPKYEYMPKLVTKGSSMTDCAISNYIRVVEGAHQSLVKAQEAGFSGKVLHDMYYQCELAVKDARRAIQYYEDIEESKKELEGEG